MKNSIGESAAYYELAQILREKGDTRRADFMGEKGRLALQEGRKPLDDWKDSLRQELSHELFDDSSDPSMALLSYSSKAPKSGNINRRYGEILDNQSSVKLDSQQQIANAPQVNPSEVLMKYGSPEFTEPLPPNPSLSTVQPKFADITPNLVPAPIPRSSSSIAARPRTQSEAINASPLLPAAPPVPPNLRLAARPNRDIAFPPEMVIPQEDTQATPVLIADADQVGKPATIATPDLEFPVEPTAPQAIAQGLPQTPAPIALAAPPSPQTESEPVQEMEKVIIVLDTPKIAVPEIPTESPQLAMLGSPTPAGTTHVIPSEKPLENKPEPDNVSEIPEPILFTDDFAGDLLTPDLPVLPTIEPTVEPIVENMEKPTGSVAPPTEEILLPDLTLAEPPPFIEITSPMGVPKIAAKPMQMTIAAPSIRPAQIAVAAPPKQEVKQEVKQEEPSPTGSKLVVETPVIAEPAVGKPQTAELALPRELADSRQQTADAEPLKVEAKKEIVLPQQQPQRQAVERKVVERSAPAKPVQANPVISTVNPLAVEKQNERKTEATDNPASLQLPKPQLDLLAKLQSVQREASPPSADPKNDLPVIPSTTQKVDIPEEVTLARPSEEIVVAEPAKTESKRALTFSASSDSSVIKPKQSKPEPTVSIKENAQIVPKQSKPEQTASIKENVRGVPKQSKSLAESLAESLETGGEKPDTKIRAVPAPVTETKSALKIVEKAENVEKKSTLTKEKTSGAVPVLRLGTGNESGTASRDNNKTVAFSGKIVPSKSEPSQKLIQSNVETVPKLEKKTVTETMPTKLTKNQSELYFTDELEERTLPKSLSLRPVSPQTAQESNNKDRKELTLKM